MPSAGEASFWPQSVTTRPLGPLRVVNVVTVFAPAHDGGYVLVGLSRAIPDLFQGVAWSTAQVMEQTRERLTDCHESWFELPPFFDVDEAADLIHVPPTWIAT